MELEVAVLGRGALGSGLWSCERRERPVVSASPCLFKTGLGVGLRAGHALSEVSSGSVGSAQRREHEFFEKITLLSTRLQEIYKY